jgi:hypothetical protein
MSSKLVHAVAHRAMKSRKSSCFQGLVARASREPKLVRCWSLPTVLMLAMLVLMASACTSSGGGSDGESEPSCIEHEVSMSVRGQVALPLGTERSAGRSSNLVLSVYQSSSSRCDGEFVQISAPGKQLLRTQLEAAAFDLPIKFITVDDLHDPWLWLNVFEDANGNGECDDDELSGSAQSEEDGTLVAPVELTDLGCPGRA